MESRRVVITGVGALTPIGNCCVDFKRALLAGTNGVNLITHFDASEYRTKFACELKGFDITRYISPKDANKMDHCTHYAIAAAEEAFADSGLNDYPLQPERAGVIVGTGIGGVTTAAYDLIDFVQDGMKPRFSPFFILKALSNMVAGQLSIRYHLQGPSYVTSAACSSSAIAMLDACHYIRQGQADVILAGGAEAAIAPVGIGGFNAMRALSTRNDDYHTASRPFSVGRDGFVMGEGAGILVLEEYEHAKARGAKIYAEIMSIGISSDAFHVTSPHADGHGAQTAMSMALREAHISPSEIGYINTHGTSTPLGDLSECLAIQSLFGSHADQLLLNSTKSMIGHLLGAAGAVESIATIIALEDGIIHPTINLIEKDPELPNWNFCSEGVVERDIHYAICNSFGFGGHNASILLKKI
ncbi:MAG: beta-ketoacyl-ACP synthase II [Bacteroidales bacterium]|nr:beta-ketoacyl-ACP synthase II [Bacteroidales bacterium]